MILDHDFQELRARVKDLEEQVEYLYQQLALDRHIKPKGDDPEIIELIRSHKTIDAIRLYRERYPTSLPDAKKAVEEMAERLGEKL